MLNRTRRTAEIALFSVLGCLSIISLATIGAAHGVAGPRLVLTPSLPRGLYWYSPGSVHRGDDVQVCLPVKLVRYARAHHMLLNGVCPENAEPLVKVLAAVEGDTLVIRREGVFIDGKRWPMSTQREFDTQGRRVDLRMNPGTYRVPAGSAFVMGLNPHSWDGRYFGFVPTTSISGRWIALLTEGVTP